MRLRGGFADVGRRRFPGRGAACGPGERLACWVRYLPLLLRHSGMPANWVCRQRAEHAHHAVHTCWRRRICLEKVFGWPLLPVSLLASLAGTTLVWTFRACMSTYTLPGRPSLTLYTKALHHICCLQSDLLLSCLSAYVHFACWPGSLGPVDGCGRRVPLVLACSLFVICRRCSCRRISPHACGDGLLRACAFGILPACTSLYLQRGLLVWTARHALPASSAHAALPGCYRGACAPCHAPSVRGVFLTSFGRRPLFCRRAGRDLLVLWFH